MMGEFGSNLSNLILYSSLFQVECLEMLFFVLNSETGLILVKGSILDLKKVPI